MAVSRRRSCTVNDWVIDCLLQKKTSRSHKQCEDTSLKDEVERHWREIIKHSYRFEEHQSEVRKHCHRVEPMRSLHQVHRKSETDFKWIDCIEFANQFILLNW